MEHAFVAIRDARIYLPDALVLHNPGPEEVEALFDLDRCKAWQTADGVIEVLVETDEGRSNIVMEREAGGVFLQVKMAGDREQYVLAHPDPAAGGAEPRKYWVSAPAARAVVRAFLRDGSRPFAPTGCVWVNALEKPQ